MLKIIVDAMGGDNAPAEIVKGAVRALEEDENFSLVFTGDQRLIGAELEKYRFDPSRVEVVHCSEVITNDDVPTKAIREKKDSSLVVGIRRLKTDESAGAFITAGSTGATLAAGVLMLGRIPGISRPALCPALPNVRGTQTLLCDCGANIACKPLDLAHFAVMASAYAEASYGVKNPKVGLLNNGTEAHKGDDLRVQTYELLSSFKGINFVGNVEGRDIMYGDCDVVVSDGFTGNIALKSIEGCGKTVETVLKASLGKNIFTKIGALGVLGTIGKLKNTLDYHKYGGAVLLGVKKIVVKAHGSSKAKSITPSVLRAVRSCRGGLVGTIVRAAATLTENKTESAQ